MGRQFYLDDTYAWTLLYCFLTLITPSNSLGAAFIGVIGASVQVCYPLLSFPLIKSLCLASWEVGEIATQFRNTLIV